MSNIYDFDCSISWTASIIWYNYYQSATWNCLKGILFNLLRKRTKLFQQSFFTKRLLHLKRKRSDLSRRFKPLLRKTGLFKKNKMDFKALYKLIYLDIWFEKVTRVCWPRELWRMFWTSQAKQCHVAKSQEYQPDHWFKSLKI